jgi:outer membrane protein assembly factor BamB
MLYHLNPTGRLAALRARTGKEVWAVDLKERFDARHGAWALAESVVVDGDRVLCVPGGTRGKIVALDRTTGTTLWANTAIDDRVAYCSPLVVTHKGVRQLMTFLRESVVSVDVRTGALLWQHEHETPYGLNVTTPLFVDGHVLVASGYAAGARLLRIGPQSKSVKQVWWCKELDNCHAGVILVDGYLYGSGCRQSKKGVLCVEYATGKVMWSKRELSKVTPVLADGLLYCLNYEGTMSLLKPDPTQCRVISQFQLPKGHSTTLIAYPVVCGGRLYVRHWDTLFAYDVRAKR